MIQNDLYNGTDSHRVSGSIVSAGIVLEHSYLHLHAGKGLVLLIIWYLSGLFLIEVSVHCLQNLY